MDLTESIAPKSDQLDAIELVSGPRTFVIERVSTHNAEQPFNFHLAGFPRVWRPGKSMRRVIVAAWGSKAEAYVGQSVTLYCDPTVSFGNEVTGGTRISHMTGIDGPLKVPLLVKRGKSAVFTVQPLTAAPSNTATHHAALTKAETIDQLVDAWNKVIADGVSSVPELVKLKDARKKELTQPAAVVDEASPEYVGPSE